MKYSINAPEAPDALGPYSQGTTAGRLVFVSGQVARDPDDPSRLVSGGVVEQARRICEIFSQILKEANCTLDDVAQTTVWLADLDDLAEFDEAYHGCFSAPRPARSVAQAARLPLGALVEMDCVACR